MELTDRTHPIRDRGLQREYMAYRRQCQRYRAKHDRTLSFQAPATIDLPLGSAGGGLQRRPTFPQSLRANFQAPLRSFRPSNPSHFEDYYPTHRKFMWHNTAAYWTSVFSIQGSLMFTFAAGVGVFKHHLPWTEDMRWMLTRWPNFVGGLMFVVAMYCAYLNLINMKKEPDERIDYLWANWAKVRQNNSEVTSRVGTMAYLYGALIYIMGVVFPLFDLTKPMEYILVTVPGTVGSVCFVIGGVCEILHNDVFGCGRAAHADEGGDEGEVVMGHGSTWRDPVWWVAVLNTVGGVNFLLGYLPGLFFLEGEAAAMFGEANFLLGSGLFSVSSWLLVLMWKSNEFGLVLLRQLNDAIGSGAAVARRRRAGQAHVLQIEVQDQADGGRALGEEEGGENSMSLRGAIFIGIYCWLNFIAIVDAMCNYVRSRYLFLGKNHPLRFITSTCSQTLVVFGVSLVLGLHSTVTEVPKEEPYRALVVLSRVVLTLGAVGQTLAFIDFMCAPLDEPVASLF